MNILKLLKGYNNNKISKLRIINNTEVIVDNYSKRKLYAVKVYFNKTTESLPRVLRFLFIDKQFTNLHSIDIFNAKMFPVLTIYIQEDIINSDKFYRLIDEILMNSKLVNNKTVTESYINILNDNVIAKVIEYTLSSIRDGLHVFFMLNWLTNHIVANSEEKYANTKAEEILNHKLFNKQSKNDSAFSAYSKVTDILKQVISGDKKGAILCGPPGMSKSYIVRRVLYFENKKPQLDYIIEKGSTASIAMFFSLLYSCKNKLLILDDFDEPLLNKSFINILKGATDSYDPRIISLSTDMQPKVTEFSKFIPTKFVYNGKLIIITNLDENSIDIPLRSRLPTITIDFDAKELISIINKMLQYILPDTSMEIKKEVYDYIVYLYSNNNRLNLNFRTFQNCIESRIGFPENWKSVIHTILDVK